MPKPRAAEKKQWLKMAFEELAKVGLTGVGAAGLMKVEDLSILEEMARSKELDIRVSAMVECDVKNSFCAEEIEGLELARRPEGIDGGMLQYAIYFLPNGFTKYCG